MFQRIIVFTMKIYRQSDITTNSHKVASLCCLFTIMRYYHHKTFYVVFIQPEKHRESIVDIPQTALSLLSKDKMSTSCSCLEQSCNDKLTCKKTFPSNNEQGNRPNR